MGGTIYGTVMEKVAHLPWIQDYMGGKTDSLAFQQELAGHKDQLNAIGLSDWWIGLLNRFPNDPWQGTRRMLELLYSAGMARTSQIDEQIFLKFEKQVERSFSHMPDRYTSIFPEEARAAYTLSCAIRPGSIFVAGSYYGYLAVWLIPGLAPNGRMLCSDVDPVVCELARQNMLALGDADRINVVCLDAEELLKRESSPIDLFVLDAYGSYGHPDPRYHGKAIYGPLLKAALPRLHKKSIILVHNAENGFSELAEFFQMVRDARLSLYLNTTDNLAIYQI